MKQNTKYYKNQFSGEVNSDKDLSKKMNKAETKLSRSKKRHFSTKWQFLFATLYSPAFSMTSF